MRIRLWMLVLGAVGIAASNVGCFGDDGGDDGGSTPTPTPTPNPTPTPSGSLASGTYAASGAGLSSTCSAGGTSYYGGVAEADVTVTGPAILIVGFPDDLGYDIAGSSLLDNTFGTPVTSLIDFTDPATLETAAGANNGNTYDCIADFTVEYAGTITGANAFTLTDTIELTLNSGSGCTVAVVSSAFSAAGILAFPCDSTDVVDLAL